MKNIIPYLLIILSFTTMITGCYSEQKAARQVFKANANFPNTVAKHCASAFNPIDATVDSFIYLPGEVEVFTDTMYLSDTVSQLRTIFINKYSYKTDTVFSIKEKQLVNRAKETYLSTENQELMINLGKSRKERQILFWTAIVLAIYTLLRWLLRLWSIRLP